MQKAGACQRLLFVSICCPEIAEEAVPGQFVNPQGTRMLAPPTYLDLRGGQSGWYPAAGFGNPQGMVPSGLPLFSKENPLTCSPPSETGLPSARGKGGCHWRGIGVPPMLELAKQYGGEAVAILGFRDESACILEEDFKRHCREVLLYTDNGTKGNKGALSPMGSKHCLRETPDVIYACGPEVDAPKHHRPLRMHRDCLRGLAGTADGLRRRRLLCLCLPSCNGRQKILRACLQGRPGV